MRGGGIPSFFPRFTDQETALFLSFLPSPRPAPFSLSPISRSPCHESPDRSINYAPYALAGIPQPVPVFAPLLIRALSLSSATTVSFAPLFSPSHPPTLTLSLSARVGTSLFFLPRPGALWRNLSALVDGVSHRLLTIRHRRHRRSRHEPIFRRRRSVSRRVVLPNSRLSWCRGKETETTRTQVLRFSCYYI